MSLYADYLKEREGYECLEAEDAFASFIMKNGECYIRDVYVAPSARKTYIASGLVDAIREIAKKNSCKMLTTSIATQANGSGISMLSILKYGFKPLRSTETMMYFFMEIK